MPIWFNNDGLYVKTGREEAVAGNTGQYGTTYQGNHVLETNLLLTTLATGSQLILDDYIKIPRGFRIERIETYVEVPATSGGSATFDFGLIAADRVTEIDYDGFLAGATLASVNAAGKKAVYDVGVSGAGALVGTLTQPNATGAYLVAKAGTAVFTAGLVKLRIQFHKP